MNPLQELHRQAEAEFQTYGDVEIVSTFGEVPAEYAAIRKGCALMDLPQRGVLELSGMVRLPFLNNLVSNQVYDKQTKTSLAAGKGVYAFLLNAKSGRIITDLNVLERGDRTLLELDRRMIGPVRETLDRYLFAEQVKMENRGGVLHELALHGPGAAEALRSIGLNVDALGPLDSTAGRVFDAVDVTVFRDDPAGVPGFFLLIPTESARKVWMEFVARSGPTDRIARRPLRPVGWAAFNATRIEAGRPMFGIDFDDSILPHETGPALERAVSFTKGCYPGQEIVARMHARQQVARRIAGIRVDGDALPLAGTKIFDDKGNEIGGVTSSTISPVLSNAAIAITLLKKPHFAVGTNLLVPAEGEMRMASVVELPFVKK
jgi:folate-binding protein YgfZ